MGDNEDEEPVAVPDEKRDEGGDQEVSDEVVELDPRFVCLGDPIVGMERVTWRADTGAGALAPKPLPSPTPMTKAQREKHNITHLPYEPSCDLCVSTRRPNTHHRKSHLEERRIPLIVGDYCFPKDNRDSEGCTVLVLKVYPYKLFFACIVPEKGPEPSMVSRVSRLIRDAGLTHFVYRSDREPATTALLVEVTNPSR